MQRTTHGFCSPVTSSAALRLRSEVRAGDRLAVVSWGRWKPFSRTLQDRSGPCLLASLVRREILLPRPWLFSPWSFRAGFGLGPSSSMVAAGWSSSCSSARGKSGATTGTARSGAYDVLFAGSWTCESCRHRFARTHGVWFGDDIVLCRCPKQPRFHRLGL
jgi:hypothetical protein